MRAENITPDFERQVSEHVMEVFVDDGVRRHLRFRKPGTMMMHFDLITWAGHLCYTGDMGTFVFTRLHDMFEFFRPDHGRSLYSIDYRYWAEKVVAQDRDGVDKFSMECFHAEVRDYLEQYADGEELSPDLRSAVEDDVLCADDEYDAWTRLREFSHTDTSGRKFYFADWERSCKEYTHRFLWCCHALRWGIQMYDAQRARGGGDA